MLAQKLNMQVCLYLVAKHCAMLSVTFEAANQVYCFLEGGIMCFGISHFRKPFSFAILAAVRIRNFSNGLQISPNMDAGRWICKCGSLLMLCNKNSPSFRVANQLHRIDGMSTVCFWISYFQNLFSFAIIFCNLTQEMDAWPPNPGVEYVSVFTSTEVNLEYWATVFVKSEIFSQKCKYRGMVTMRFWISYF